MASNSPSPTSKSTLEGSLAEVAYWLGDTEASKRYALDSLRTAEAGGFAELSEGQQARRILLRAHRLDGSWDAGDAVLAELLRVNEAQPGGSNEAAGVLEAAAKYTYAKGDFESTVKHARRAREIVEADLGAEAPETAAALEMEATGLIALGQLEQAEALLDRATALLESSKAATNLQRMSIAHARARLLEAAGEHHAAAALVSELIRNADVTDPEQEKAREDFTTWMVEHAMTPPL